MLGQLSDRTSKFATVQATVLSCQAGHLRAAPGPAW